MTEGGEDGDSEAAAMPSWSASNTPSDKTVTPSATGAATAVERVRRLLEQLFAGRPIDRHRPRPKR
jgi:hypothetical protein